MLLGAAVFGRSADGFQPRLGLAAFAGGLLPDIPAFLLVGLAALRGRGAADIFGADYFSPAWQAVMAPFHSVPLWAAALALGWRSPLAHAFAASGLLHQALDFPFHHDDPHRHFWPLTDWRFASPLSYWDPAHGGAWVQPMELLVGLAVLVWLWPRWPGRPARAFLVLSALLYTAQAVAAAVYLAADAQGR
jgi:hypothetical protein